ncbi:fibronectin type III domain protein [Microcella putealis]|uniref:Fibronectin type III domain protein n=1 Tax=Microcella putealis TaxID=337005 RepID=A0A4Q7LY64_9MICO|nr:Ig-like domain-containing protein [Microcella putealis]RZS59483.1 fibronectin type III domain protein [Microcella putealis]TQM26596.1 fibronectin type III domain protein [Microcella putealis]
MSFSLAPRGRRSLASALAIALVAGGTVTVAALHDGFPVADVDLTARDVWVTNGAQQLGGRLNRQIEELNGSVVASSAAFDVLQQGDALFLLDPDNARVESVDAATTRVTSAIDVPPNAQIDHGGDVLAIVADGSLWAISAAGDLQFNFISQPPTAEVGDDAKVAVSDDGVVIVVSPSLGQVLKLESLAEEPVVADFPAVGDFELAAVGDRAVVLDRSTNELVGEDGRVIPLGDDAALELQQSGPRADFAVVATGDALLRVGLDSGDVDRWDAGVASPTDERASVASPVVVDGCAHGAWGHAQRYVLACDSAVPEPFDIAEPTAGSRLEFRVNGSVVALNDLTTGNAWVPSDTMRLVNNWEDVTPPVQEDSPETGDEESANQSFEDTLAERTDENRAPTAVDDEFGIRPGRTTVLSVLDNDSDPDGDVLVISAVGAVAEATGRLELIDGGRALQFTQAPDFAGTIAFDYTVDDGRGGTASARVSARVVPDGSNEQPVELRTSGVAVEANQTIEYNVLANWRDPDGDELYLVGATPNAGDLVRFSPDGTITFTHQTSELGEKTVQFLVADGQGDPVAGTLTVTVEPASSLNPVGTPDFATLFVDETVIIEPLANDLSPSGAVLSLAAIAEPGEGAAATLDTDRDEVRFSASSPGIYYFTYTVQAGGASSTGIVRVDVSERPETDDAPPIAVRDTAYLRGDQPLTVSVLANDVSPSGRILAVQSIDVPAATEAAGVTVELLASTLVRITATAALTEQVDLSYTVSDGVQSATAGVTVVPVPALTKHQPPVARDDSVTVRAGDIVTVDVTDNDVHPDASPLIVADELITTPSAGIAFVSANTVRFQAPDEPGQYTAEYLLTDPYGETAAAAVIFTVTPLDTTGNADPRPADIIGRVLAGNNVRIDLPLDQVDPDGDSVELLRAPSGATLGTIVESGPTHFVYEAAETTAGTDTFRYQVVDAFGAVGDAEVRIAVIPQPDTTSNPTAVPDSVSVRPGRVSQLDLLANDSDPQGAEIRASDTLLDVPDGIDAEVVDARYLVLTAPDTEQSFSLRYEITNDRGGRDIGYVLVQVTEDAPLLPPTATDVSVARAEIAGEESVTVDIFDGYAFNPSGSNDELLVSLEGPNASNAALDAERPGIVTVTPVDRRQAITYRVTNVDDELSAYAFIIVPAAVDEGFDEPPFLDPALPVQYVPMNESREWSISELLVVPSEREVWIPEPELVTATQSDGTPAGVDRDTIRFQGALDYRGPASITFTVTDGASAEDPNGNTVTLTLPIVVGDPEFRDTAPEFTTPSVEVEVGEQSTIDLRSSTAHPNPQILQEVTYSDLRGQASGVDASLSGSTLTVSAPRTAQKGTTLTLDVNLRWDDFTVPGTITVTVVGSSRPPAVAVDDNYEAQRGDGTLVANPLANDSNPYQSTGEPLTIVGATVQNTGEPATVSFTASTVSITPSPTLKSGTVVVVYRVEDATRDPDRAVNGTITLVVSDVPDQVLRPTVPAQGDEGSVTIGFQAPASNGKPITGYEVVSNPSVPTPTDCAPPSCTISGLTNGTSYTFAVRAINVHGAGPWSPVSNPVIPYGTPGTPAVTLTVGEQWAPGGAVSATWGGVAASGGSLSYTWELLRGTTSLRSGTTTGTSTGNLGNLDGGSYTVRVFATNSGGRQGATGTSNAGTVTTQGTPGRPSVSATVTDGSQPGAIRWNWNAVTANPGGSANISYEVRLNGSGGWTGVGSNTSYTRSNLNQGSYTLEVRAVNKSGPGSAGSASASVGPPPPPPQQVFLSRGDFEPSTSNGYYYRVRLSGFTGPVTLQCFDSGGGFASVRTVEPDFNGQLGCYSGFGNYRVLANGSIWSNTVQSWD